MVFNHPVESRNEKSFFTSRTTRHQSPTPMETDDNSAQQKQQPNMGSTEQMDSLNQTQMHYEGFGRPKPYQEQTSRNERLIEARNGIEHMGINLTSPGVYSQKTKDEVSENDPNKRISKDAKISADQINTILKDLSPEGRQIFMNTFEKRLCVKLEKTTVSSVSLLPQRSEIDDNVVIGSHLLVEVNKIIEPNEAQRETRKQDASPVELFEKSPYELFGNSIPTPQINNEHQPVNNLRRLSGTAGSYIRTSSPSQTSSLNHEKLSPVQPLRNDQHSRGENDDFDIVLASKVNTNNLITSSKDHSPNSQHHQPLESIPPSFSSTQKLFYDSKPPQPSPPIETLVQEAAIPLDRSENESCVHIKSEEEMKDNPLPKAENSNHHTHYDYTKFSSTQRNERTNQKEERQQKYDVSEKRSGLKGTQERNTRMDEIRNDVGKTPFSYESSKPVNESKQSIKSSPSFNSLSPTSQSQIYIPPKTISLETIASPVASVKKDNASWLQDTAGLHKFGSSTKKSVNILVLGQTGVGKSTWINALINYLSYQTLEEAIAAEAPMCSIPTKFTMFDGNYQRHDVILGGDENEDFTSAAQSVTQNTRTYVFEREDSDVYIIDTPGMDDTRGIEKDDENIQKILRSIAPFKEIHAICFLFKANESRLTQSFRYSISKLLSHLSKSALNNSCFVFTNSRGTFYRPGDTMGPLKQYFRQLEENDGLSVKIHGDNTFCIDNEAFRFLCAHFSNIQFTSPEMKTFADSWRHSSKEMYRLLEHASRVRPHNTSDTLSINETKTWIYQLIDPILQASSIIQTNIRKLDNQKEELLKAENNVDELRRLVSIRVTTMVIEHLQYPQTVCGSRKCAEIEMIDGRQEVIYKQVCHKDCRLELNADLSNCCVFPRASHRSTSTTTSSCLKCGCHINLHNRIKYKQRVITKSLENPQKLTAEMSATELKKKSIRRLEKLIDGYQNERKYILLAMANFSTFLAENGIAQKINLFEQELEKLIEKKEQLLRIAGGDPTECDQLIELKKMYQNICYQFAHQQKSKKISLEELQEIRPKLFSMPLSGSSITEIFGIHVKVDNQDYESEVKKVKKTMLQKIVSRAESAVSNGMEKVKSFFRGSQ